MDAPNHYLKTFRGILKLQDFSINLKGQVATQMYLQKYRHWGKNLNMLQQGCSNRKQWPRDAKSQTSSIDLRMITNGLFQYKINFQQHIPQYFMWPRSLITESFRGFKTNHDSTAMALLQGYFHFSPNQSGKHPAVVQSFAWTGRLWETPCWSTQALKSQVILVPIVRLPWWLTLGTGKTCFCSFGLEVGKYSGNKKDEHIVRGKGLPKQMA